ncbi:phenylacetic acid degradation protein [Mycolicibacterium duvalii]|uniref:Phenylacetic acid degradation protein n=1 Tax=Mycolicibacterium duvalii TaxID=39688 RepID=A0A7I7K842_9MYCO|nr:PaaI family thioesterase [Mycolicibacterium duvalii]MCV7366219.1 PaaI family thioesterase [Mycolicibacterium duvalii]PEG38866.1 phenylacetic acid degradation protein [Mycolicibacterium duvalii]BBX19671.1 phenylacetic acid degradation protein [Mycolicibacterium duvalii]
MPYPLNTPLGRFGVETLEDGAERCVATIPAAGLTNPLTGAATVAPLAMLVDHVCGLVNHRRRGTDEWTVSSELSLEIAPDAAHAIAAAPQERVTGIAQPLGAKFDVALAQCRLSVAGHDVATATVHSFYITAPAGLSAWPEESHGSLPGPDLASLMSLERGETGGAAVVLMQKTDDALNNSVGVVHGGVSAMGLELVGSAAVCAAADAAFRTASLRVNYLRPFHSGSGAHYEATTLHVGRSSGVAETRAVGHDGRDALVARLTAYR